MMRPCTVRFPCSVGDSVRHGPSGRAGVVTCLYIGESGLMQAFVENTTDERWHPVDTLEPVNGGDRRRPIKDHPQA